ncbi:MAG TPA: TauD/TfdA family dioxygenase [Nonomuraea sp.]|nr:TauD/TfdA family dioxygenase [Nonomuraea sp.]
MNDLSPLDVLPRDRGLRLLDWAPDNLDRLREALRVDGVVWLRGFAATEPDLCQHLLVLIGSPLVEDVFWSTPRSRVSDKTFTATEYPARETIPPHSEMAYLTRYPRLLAFHALRRAETGGQTTVADLDAVSADLADLAAEFEQRKVCYVRVFRDGIDIPVTTAFGTDDPAEITTIAETHGMRVETAADGTTRLTHTAQGVLVDATDGRHVWFNQAHLSHPASLPQPTRDALTALVGPDGMPRQAFFADGEPIPDRVIHNIGSTFARHTVPIDWLPGDVVLIDNLRHAHGRLPYTGARTVHVAMGLPQTGDRRRLLFAE